MLCAHRCLDIQIPTEIQILFGILALQPLPRPSWLYVACSTHSRFRLGQSTAVGSAASSVLYADLRACGRRAASARHYARPGRPRPPARDCACTRGSAGRNRPPHTPWRGPVPAPARTHSSPTTARPRATGGRKRTHSSSKRVQLPSDSGSALTFVAEIHLPCTTGACGRARRASAAIGRQAPKLQAHRDKHTIYVSV